MSKPTFPFFTSSTFNLSSVLSFCFSSAINLSVFGVEKFCICCFWQFPTLHKLFPSLLSWSWRRNKFPHRLAQLGTAPEKEDNIFPRRLRLWGNTDFRCGAPGFYPGKTNLCLWRADGDIRHAERTPNIPPDNDPCPTKIAHQMKGREGGHKQFSSPDELLDQLVPSWPQSTRPLPPSTPSRKSYIYKSLLMNWICWLYFQNSLWVVEEYSVLLEGVCFVFRKPPHQRFPLSVKPTNWPCTEYNKQLPVYISKIDLLTKTLGKSPL